MSYICLYDNNCNALGNWTQHIAKEWSLNRKAVELDEFSATCQGWEQSKKACFVGLHENTGALKYICFCGIPSTSNGLTKIMGIDCRSLFKQTIYVNYGKMLTSGIYAITSARSLFQYLMADVFSDLAINLGINYSLDLDDMDFVSTWSEDKIVRTNEIRSVYDEIQKYCSVLNVVVTVTTSVNVETNKYSLIFKVTRIYQSRNIKLSDYDVTMKLNQNITNRAIATDGTSSLTYYLYNDNTIGDTYDESKCLFPPVTETVFNDDVDLEAAKTDAQALLVDNRYKDKVTIDLKTKLGATLEDLDFTFFGDIVGYNPADPNTIKRLPVSSVLEGSTGSKKISFGRLSDYWFLED